MGGTRKKMSKISTIFSKKKDIFVGGRGVGGGGVGKERVQDRKGVLGRGMH